MQLELNPQKAIELLLQEQYFAEFEVIDRLNQHPKGLNFYEWLYKKKLISKEHLDLQLEELIKEEE